jgi:hypothetical protein
MKPRPIAITIGKTVVLAAVMFILWAAFSGLFMSLIGSSGEGTAPGEPQGMGRMLSMMLLVSLINTFILVIMLSRSTWNGMRLVLTIALQIFGIQYVLTFSEAFLFNRSLGMPEPFMLAHLLAGLCMALSFSFIAAAIMGRVRGAAVASHGDGGRRRMRWPELLWRLLLLSVILYPLIYFLAGYFIAFRSEAVKSFYTSSPERMPFLESAGDFWGSSLYLFQIVRGAIWVLIALPVIRMMKGNRWERAFIVGLVFALIMNSQHLLPNAHMPADIRLVHFIETASSNLLWGMAVGYFLR